MRCHLRAGEITVERVSCNSLSFRITVTVFTNTINTNVLFGGEDDWLDFGDGNRMLIPEQPNVPRPDLGEGIATASFTWTHTYSGNGRYVISYSEPNRNAGVLNMDGSVNTRFYIETLLIVDPFLGCNNSPKLLVPPIDRACTGITWFHNPGAYDPDGDSLSYVLVVPFRDKNAEVVNYRDPNEAEFYGTDFNNGNEAGTGTPTFDINPVDGTLTWDAPGDVQLGEYNIAFVVREWRRINGVWINIGFVRRDMQIIVEECDNERPELEVPEDVCVEAGSTLNATITGTDPDGDSVKIEAFSEVFNFAAAESPATYTPFPAKFQKQPATLEFQWNTECAHIKDQPYQVVFKITDKSPTGSRLVTFKTWLIRVVGPEPEWVSATTDLATRSANLAWDPYICENAESIQIWRKVDSFAFEPDSCQTGMPEQLGYSLIATISDSLSTYTDTNQGQGLASGAQYCYRLVAVFPLPRGGESYVSEEICLDPILADKAIITNVTVDITHDQNGQITVKWLPPFEADPVQFPPPYKYQVLRAEGFAGDGNLSLLTTTTDLTYIDNSAGLDTEAKVYNYRIIAVDSENKSLDPSSTASTVRLEADSQLDRIQLTWSAFVPWSNQIQSVPNRHLIYRGAEGAADNELVLLDSVDPTVGGFTYVDNGPLEQNTVYCYKVMTRGAYGNPQIPEPLLNFSQMICAQPGDSTKPCPPGTPVPDQPLDCETYVTLSETCNTNIFSNTLHWARPDAECANDVSFYRIWVANSSNDDYVLLPVEVRDTIFIDENLPSFARCYRIQAVDRSGNESELSEPVCFDNCPYYELPNFFSPGNGDLCNDLFSAFSNRNTTGENPEERCAIISDESRGKCARFVEKVFFTVYNRWGKEVYSYESGGERTIYIDWDGRDSNGRELSTGVYYYVANVTFDSVDPEKQNQTIEGCLHLQRGEGVPTPLRTPWHASFSIAPNVPHHWHSFDKTVIIAAITILSSNVPTPYIPAYIMTAYIFPGQGAQFPGMAKDIYEQNPKAKSLLDEANGILGFNITNVMFSGTAEELKQTQVTQPAIFLHSVAIALTSESFKPDMVAGHSLGEFSALVSNRCLSFADGLKLVYKRAIAMQKACEANPSTMAAILGLDDNVVEEICASIDDVVVAANYNCPGQLVISGTIRGVDIACEKLKAAGAKRALPLQVGGAFHSPLMEPAREELAKAIGATAFNQPICPVYQNVTALPSTDVNQIKNNLIAQLTAPVRWTQSVRKMTEDGARTFIECGPGKVLQGLVKKISPDVQVASL